MSPTCWPWRAVNMHPPLSVQQRKLVCIFLVNSELLNKRCKIYVVLLKTKTSPLVRVLISLTDLLLMNDFAGKSNNISSWMLGSYQRKRKSMRCPEFPLSHERLCAQKRGQSVSLLVGNAWGTLLISSGKTWWLEWFSRNAPCPLTWCTPPVSNGATPVTNASKVTLVFPGSTTASRLQDPPQPSSPPFGESPMTFCVNKVKED